MNREKEHFLDIFFNPRSVAVVGASQNPTTANYFLTANLINLKYTGKIYPVNPSADKILGLKVYPNVQSIEDEVDLVAISLPALKVPGILRDCVMKGVKAIIITAGGFSETGVNGKQLQEEMKQILKGSGIRVIGPNSLSPMNSALNFIVGFGPMTKLTKGKLSFVFQSGLYQPRLDYLISSMHLNINKLIDLGNKMDINEVDVLEYFNMDESTEAIAMHLESIAGDGHCFFNLLKEITLKKPVIVLKSGRTEDGARAASSHTGAIMKSGDHIYDVALKQAGAIRVQGLDEFFDLAKIFEYYSPLKGNRIAIASFSGGEGVIGTDFCQWHGLQLARSGKETREKMRKTFPPWEIEVNPFDTGVTNQFHPEMDVDTVFLDTLGNDPDTDCMVIQIGSPMSQAVWNPSEYNRKFVGLCQDAVSRGKAVAIWTVDPRHVQGLVNTLEEARIPVYPSVERAVRALGALYRYNLIRKRS